MADWAQIVVGIAAVVVAIGVIGAKVIRPLWSAAQKADVMIPLLDTLTTQLSNVPDVFSILREIVGQVRSDSGSSLLDIIKRLESASIANATANTALLTLLASLGVRVDGGAATALRNEAFAAGVAANLAEAQKRADDITGAAGEAADAASRSGPDADP